MLRKSRSPASVFHFFTLPAQRIFFSSSRPSQVRGNPTIISVVAKSKVNRRYDNIISTISSELQIESSNRREFSYRVNRARSGVFWILFFIRNRSQFRRNLTLSWELSDVGVARLGVWKKEDFTIITQGFAGLWVETNKTIRQLSIESISTHNRPRFHWQFKLSHLRHSSL